MIGGWRIGRIAGIDIRVDPSWVVIAVLITANMWALFSGLAAGPAAAIALGIGAAALFFLSILGHELAHALVSKARGIPVSGITLFLFGGATHARVDAKRPVDEFLVTVVGPATSALIGFAFLAAHAWTRAFVGGPAAAMFGYLALANLVMAAFNLLPGFPLDGGRLLRSGLWKATGSLARATEIAARVGQIVAAAIIGLAVLAAVRTQNAFEALWPGLIGWFLYRAAAAALAEGRRRRVLERTTARDVMAPPPPTIDARLPLAVATDRYLAGHDGEAFPVVDDGGVIGFVSLRTSHGAADGATVRDATVGRGGVVDASADEPINDILDRVGTERGRTILVLDGRRLVGVIEPEDLGRFLRTQDARGASGGVTNEP